MTTTVRPPFAYFGGKTTLGHRIAALLPAHRHYIEPYAGSLAVLLAKPRAQFETVNDLDQDLVLFWRVLRERGDELASVCALTPHSRADHTAAFDLDVTDELERARRVWVRLSQGRGGMLRRTGWRFYRDASRRTGSMPWTRNAYVDRLWDATERLAGVSLECRPALSLITDYGQHPNVLIYADPPYLGSTRGWGNQYQHEMRGEPEHRELAAARGQAQPPWCCRATRRRCTTSSTPTGTASSSAPTPAKVDPVDAAEHVPKSCGRTADSANMTCSPPPGRHHEA